MGRCAWPVARLDADGVLLEWADLGDPQEHVSRSLGVPVTIGGRPSREAVDRPGYCARIGGTETITVQMPNTEDNIYAIEACLRGPDLTRTARQVQSIINSISFTS